MNKNRLNIQCEYCFGDLHSIDECTMLRDDVAIWKRYNSMARRLAAHYETKMRRPIWDLYPEQQKYILERMR
jgi:hypothetical protein